ncbi:MAG: amidohydrolase family protein [Hellea sp.]|nr:amidohydrolase family protein [Hellea sp.]
MSLDVSPDGETIAFDLLGDIYTMPVSGGKATNLTSDMAWDMQPRFSPDGSQIAFTSDRAGGDNIWVMDVDGENKEQVTKESFRLTNNPTWSPDGRFIAAKKHFTTSRSLGTGEIWLYHTSGGSGVQLVKRPSESHQKELGEPMFSPDGRYVYYTQNTTPGSQFIYAQDSNTELFQIKRYDMETGDIITAAGGEGGAVRPAPSPDGKYLAYVKRERMQSMLYLRDLESGEETRIYDKLDRDMQETWGVQGMYPNMDWSADSTELYFWAGGKIKKINVANGDVETINFRVRDSRDVMTAPRPDVEVAPSEFETNMPRYAQVSPNGRKVVYESLGKLYVRNVSGGAPKRLTRLPENIREYDPSWTRDGRHLTFISWSDEGLGTIHRINASGGGLTDLTVKPGHYRRPAMAPDGEYVVYEKNSGGFLTSDIWSNEPGLYIQAVGDDTPQLIRRSGSGAHFGSSNLRIYFTDNVDGTTSLVSTNLLGDDERVHASSEMSQGFYISPNDEMIAFRENYNLYAMPVLAGPQNVSASRSGNALPVTKLSTNGSTYPSWSGDSDTVYWTLGPDLYEASISEAVENEDYEQEQIANLSWQHNADKPEGSILLANARIITMSDEDGGVIENGSILIEGDRIVAIGEDIPQGDDIEVVDLKGKTIIPGLIDAHAHGPQGVSDMTPEQNWKAVAHLALGVTTIFDPSSQASAIFPAAEFQQAGKILGPRIFSTGEVIYGAKAPGFFAAIDSAEDASEHVTRLNMQGAHGVKNYNQPRREQRQQVTHAAREQNILVVPEGGSLYHMDMSLVVDGNSSIEHNLPVGEIYDDVIQLMSQTNTAYVPTLVVTYGGVRGEAYYYQNTNVWEHPILSNHVPPRQLQASSVRRQMAPDEDYGDADAAAVAKKLQDAGVLVTIGAHGQREGLAAHWEIWSFARGGMDPIEALQTATIDPAKHLGFFEDIGSIEEGKLADLVILDDNPLDDIYNTDHIDMVMQGGRLYDAETMDEVITGDKKRLPYWWEK